MANLFGAGKGPKTGVALGRAYPVFATPAELIAAAVEKLPVMMGALDRQHATDTVARIELAKPVRAAVAGFDLMFTAAKSASTLWALGDASTQQPVLDAHHGAVTNALAFLEDLALFTRTGNQGCEQVRARAMIAAGFDHWDTRTGDPKLYNHVVLANKIQGPDGARRSVDSRALHHAAVAVSEVYDNLFADELARRLPVGWGWPDRGPQRTPAFELDGVDDDLLKTFSTMSCRSTRARSARWRSSRHPRAAPEPNRDHTAARGRHPPDPPRQTHPPAR